MAKRVALSVSVMFTLIILIGPASAQSIPSLKRALNESAICKPLKFDAKDVFKLFGVTIPATPIDTTVGWDNENHDVKTFTVDANHKLHSDMTIGCQPSDEGAILKLVGKKGVDVRLTEDATCTGTVGDGNAVPDLACTTNGEGAKFLNRIADLDGQLRPVFQKALSSP